MLETQQLVELLASTEYRPTEAASPSTGSRALQGKVSSTTSGSGAAAGVPAPSALRPHKTVTHSENGAVVKKTDQKEDGAEPETALLRLNHHVDGDGGGLLKQGRAARVKRAEVAKRVELVRRPRGYLQYLTRHTG